MEIKILCDCGTRFKFEVEPIHGRMPAPVHCPSCNNDCTSQANGLIQEQLNPAVSGSEPVLPAMASASSSAPANLVAAAAPVPGSPLRINLGSKTPPPIGAGPGSLAPPPVASPPPFGTGRRAAVPPPSASNKLKGALATVGTVVVIALGVFGFTSKWFRRVRNLARIATEVAAGGEAPDTTEASIPKNLVYDDCVALFIQHSNHLEVAEACKQYWKEQLHKNLTLIAVSEDGLKQGTAYQLSPAYNGYVRIIGDLEWPETSFEGLCQYLSQRFGSLVFEMKDVDFSGAFHFGVYEKGARKFHSQMDVRIVQGDEKDTIKNEGEDWVVSHGYQPGSGGFKKFSLFEGDRVTQALGMKLWDEPPEVTEKLLLLKE